MSFILSGAILVTIAFLSFTLFFLPDDWASEFVICLVTCFFTADSGSEIVGIRQHFTCAMWFLDFVSAAVRIDVHTQKPQSRARFLQVSEKICARWRMGNCCSESCLPKGISLASQTCAGSLSLLIKPQARTQNHEPQRGTKSTGAEFLCAFCAFLRLSSSPQIGLHPAVLSASRTSMGNASSARRRESAANPAP